MWQPRLLCASLLVVGVLLWPAWDVWKTYQQARSWREQDLIDDVSLFEKRFSLLRDRLPDQGTIGYRDEGKGGLPRKRHALAQYALAPLHVEWQGKQAIRIEVSGEDGSLITVKRREGP